MKKNKNKIQFDWLFQFLWIILTLSLVGCSKNVTGPESTNNTIATPLSKFSDIQAAVFTPSCALSGCHAGSTVQANLNLTDGNAYNNLINQQSVLNPSFVRVKPGDSQNSFLIKMLRNSGSGSSLMPPTGALNPAIIDSIEAWINNGALNN